MTIFRTFATLLAIIGTALVGSNASADIITNITLSGLDTNNQFNSSLGTPMNAVPGPISTPTASTSFGVSSATFSYTVNALDLTGDGSANDSVVFSYLADASADNVANVGNPFSFGVDGTGDPGDNEIDPGESLFFSNLNAVATLGDANAGTFTVNSALFDFFQSRFPGGGDVFTLTDGSGNAITPAATPDGGGNDPYDFSANPQPVFDIISSAGNGFGIDSIAADFVLEFTPANVVPEPSSLALLGLGGMFAFSRRRRS